MPVQWIAPQAMYANTYRVGDILVDAGALPMAMRSQATGIRTIVLTHCHYDHTVHLPELLHMTGAEVSIHELDAPGLSDEARNLSFHFGARSPGVVPSRLLHEGDRVGPFTVLHTPGHTPGSICLWDPDERVLLSGDTVFPNGSFGRTDFPGGSGSALRASLARLAALPVERLYPGHEMPVLEGAHRHIAASLRFFDSGYG